MHLPPELWVLICENMDISDLSRLYTATKDSPMNAHVAAISAERARYTIYHRLLQCEFDLSFTLEDSTYKPRAPRARRRTGQPRTRPPVPYSQRSLRSYYSWLRTSWLRASLVRKDTGLGFRVSTQDSQNGYGWISSREYGTDISRIGSTSMRFLGPAYSPYIRINHCPAGSETTVHENVEDGYIYKTLERQLVLSSVCWESLSPYHRSQPLPKSWFEDVVGPNLHLSITLRKPITPNLRPLEIAFQVYRVQLTTDIFRVPSSDGLLRLFPGQVEISETILKDFIHKRHDRGHGDATVTEYE